MPRATLQSQLGNLVVKDRVALGLKVMENNRDVTYRDSEGKAVSFRTNDGLIDGLIQHAGNRAIPAHLTHEWTKGEKDPLTFRVGAFKNFRKDDSGALLADFHAMPGVDGDKMLWLAETDPENAALSTVFDYNRIKSGDVTYAYPLSFDSADFVAKGASCARLADFKPTDTDMTEEQINKLVEDRVTAKLATFTPKAPEGFITKEDSDKAITAALAAYKPELTEAQLAEINTKAEAAVIAKLGSGPMKVQLGDSVRSDKYTATLAKFKETHTNPGAAIRAMLTMHPELHAEHEAQLQRQVATLNAA